MLAPRMIRGLVLQGALALLLLVSCPFLRGPAEAAISCAGLVGK